MCRQTWQNNSGICRKLAETSSRVKRQTSEVYQFELVLKEKDLKYSSASICYLVLLHFCKSFEIDGFKSRRANSGKGLRGIFLLRFSLLELIHGMLGRWGSFLD